MRDVHANKYQYLGRAKDPAEFVKHGSREATIEIELQRKPSMRKNPVITRVIKREGNQSTFFCNGKQVSGREVLHLANSFNIQIDNLCQFLPQDKVVEFAQMSPIELLVSTQRAVAGPELIKYHDDLKKLRGNQSNFVHEAKQDQAHLTQMMAKQAEQQTAVERMRERALVKDRLEKLERSRTVLQYIDAKETAKKAKDLAKARSEDVKRLEATAAPFIQKVRSSKEYIAKAKTFRTTCENELNASLVACKERTKDIVSTEEAIKDLNTKIEAERAGFVKKRQVMSREQGKLLEHKRKKAETPESFDVTGLTKEMNDLKAQQTVIQNENAELKIRKTDLRDQGQKRKKDVENLNGDLENLGTQAGQQEQKLKTLSLDTWKAWKWIQENQNAFKQPVYGPPIVECSLTDPSMADAIESLLQPSDFKFITVQNKDDFTLLQRELFRKKTLHDVSLRECNTDGLGQFRRPLSPEEMERFGLSGWALDYLQGPSTVLAQLCHEKSLHRCALSSRELSQQLHDELATTDIQGYAAGKKIYQFIRRKEYGAAGTSARVQDIRHARFWTDQPVDMGRKAVLQRDLNEANDDVKTIHSEYEAVKKQMMRLEQEHQSLEKDIAAKLAEKHAKQQAFAVYDALDFTIQQAEDAINNLRDSVNGVRTRISALQDEVDAALLEKTEAVLKFVSATRNVKSKTASLLEAEVIHIEAVSDQQVLKSQNDELIQTIRQKQAEKDAADELYDKQKDRALTFKDDAVRLQAECKRLAQEGDDSFLELLRHVCSTLETEENLDAEIGAEKARLEFTEGGDAIDIVGFERRAKDIQKVQAKVQDASERQEAFKAAIEDIRTKWEPRLEEFVTRINTAFADSFARIGCAGQVAVHKASSADPVDCTEETGGMENGLDFANWAIHISVKFREQEPLSLLDSHRQSGGERAVSTIFYLMALQSLSRAPFRVVDEINQGMDPRNERMVHGRMVDIAADDGGSQYFLITPKLLSGLKYRRGMTVLCIVSGENMPAARERDEDGDWHDGPKVDFRLFIKRAKELGIAGAAGGKRIDSGVGMGRSFGSASPTATVGA